MILLNTDFQKQSALYIAIGKFLMTRAATSCCSLIHQQASLSPAPQVPSPIWHHYGGHTAKDTKLITTARMMMMMR